VTRDDRRKGESNQGADANEDRTSNHVDHMMNARTDTRPIDEKCQDCKGDGPPGAQDQHCGDHNGGEQGVIRGEAVVPGVRNERAHVVCCEWTRVRVGRGAGLRQHIRHDGGDAEALAHAYTELAGSRGDANLLVQTYFGQVGESFHMLASLPVQGIGLDFVRGSRNLDLVGAMGFPQDKVLAAGLVDGRNVWITDMESTLELVQNLGAYVPFERLLINPSSSLMHVPLDVRLETHGTSIFHLLTHAFFKACLFLGAGSVIHAMGGVQDMRLMAGLRERLPITFWTFLAATLALCGIPPFAGFFSKDLILASTYSSGQVWLWALGIVTVGLTALYMFRLLFMTFNGASRLEPVKAHHVHDSPLVIAVPLVVLAIFSMLGGWVGLPEGILWGDAFEHFLAPIAPTMMPGAGASVAGGGLPPPAASAIALIVALIGIALAWIFYLQNPELPARLAQSLRGLYRLLLGKYYIDELYNLFISRPLFWISQFVLFRGIDAGIIDGIVDGTGLGVEGSGEALRQVETGNVRHYAFIYLLGVLAISAYYVYLAMP